MVWPKAGISAKEGTQHWCIKLSRNLRSIIINLIPQLHNALDNIFGDDTGLQTGMEVYWNVLLTRNIIVTPGIHLQWNSTLNTDDDYAVNYLSLTNELIKQSISQRKKIDKLIVTYYKKVKKSNGAKVAAQFYQLENYILVAIRMTIMEKVPFIGELDEN